MLICAFEKLAITVKDLCKLNGDTFFAPMHLAGKLHLPYILLKFLFHIFEKTIRFALRKIVKNTFSRSYQQWQCVYSIHYSYFLSNN